METKPYSIGDIDVINARLAQADAILTTILGEGFENFALHSHKIQEDVIWGIQDLIGGAIKEMNGGDNNGN